MDKYPIKPSDCKNDKNAKYLDSGKCKCNDGWNRVSKDQPCTKCINDDVCVNGTCNKSGECVCKTGWSIGDSNKCDKYICKDILNTKEDPSNPGKCMCKTGWKSGKPDDTPLDCDICENNNACQHAKCELSLYPPRCGECDPGWGSSRSNGFGPCNVKIPDCYTNDDCNNNGNCVDNKCYCNTGYYGKNCSKKS